MVGKKLNIMCRIGFIFECTKVSPITNDKGLMIHTNNQEEEYRQFTLIICYS